MPAKISEKKIIILKCNIILKFSYKKADKYLFINI